MIGNTFQKHNIVFLAALMLIFIAATSSLLDAKDTDIYEVSTKQNCYILLDNSESMDFGVYEQSIDYGEMFDYLFELNESGSPYNTYIYDTVNNSDYFHNNHKERRKIFLWKGRIGVTTATVDGTTKAFTGDAADPNYLWFSADLVDTNVTINSDGELTYDGSGTQRLTVDTDGTILFDGAALPMNQSIKLNDIRTMYDGTQVNAGFGGLLNAPGYYFSGYEGVTAGSLNVAESGDQDVYFFVTGNWVNMQAMYNLHYVTNNPDPTGASTGDMAWKYEEFPLTASSWLELSHSVQYPASGQYENKLSESQTMKTITHPGATQIQVHFSAFDVEGNSNSSTWNKDYVAIYDGAGTLVQKYDNDNSPTSGDGWSATVSDDTVKIALDSNNSVVGDGYTIDKIRVTYGSGSGGSYLMQNRLDVAKDAILYVIDEFHGKMNWGYASFQYTAGGSGDGATINSALNPNLTDDQNRAAITGHVENESPQNGGTPLGEALQDVFEKGYWTKRSALDNLGCRKNYVISVTDGFPSDDDEWDRISDTGSDSELPFSDWDNDNWTADPYQYVSPPDNYYDDVGHWMYTHSWKSATKDLITDPANSYDNVTTHHIAFGADHPLLMDAAGESGGEYVVAYNKEQLVAAFYSLALKMTEAVSFTSPVVSIDAANKIQNGDDLYLGLFLPQDNLAWMGNIKKFKLGDGSTDRPVLSMLYDAANNEAISSSGEFLDNTNGFWGDDTDQNDSDNYGSADVREDGVGEVLKERVESDFGAGTYWERPIYTWNVTLSSMLKVKYDTVTAAELNVADDATRDKVLNYLYGYTYDADATTHAPSATRDWMLGAIVHSRPVVVEYYDPSDLTVLLKRYIVVGANDGMFHVFDDSNGQEVFAFVPPDLLPNLQNLPDNPFVDTVDGNILLYRYNTAPKYLIFGERRGGAKFWCLNITDSNPLNWTVQWNYTNSEILQSWSEPIAAKVPVSVNATTGERTFKDVIIITGGYDTEEDLYPEPFNDLDYSGSPYKNTGAVDGAEWDKNNAAQDVNSNNIYDIYNLDKNEYGRGIFIFDIDDPTAETKDGNGVRILPFSVTYDTSDSTTVNGTNGATQTRTDMTFCFPASPSVVSETVTYLYKNSSGVLTEGIVTNVLKTVYATDIYTNVFRINFDFEVTESSGSYAVSENNWTVAKIFSGNPASPNASGSFSNTATLATSDQGRKAFYPPEVSWGGSCNYFDRGNYRFDNTAFYGTDKIASLFFGTGDREHPTYKLVKNRIYAIYDDSQVTAIYDPDATKVDKQVTGIGDSAKTPSYYTEVDLLNLTYDELDTGSSLTAAQQEVLREILRDEPYYNNFTTLEEGYTNEDDAKGWYIILEDQADKDLVDHAGEKILSKVRLFAGVLYFTSYQPSIFDACSPQGNGLAYSLNYCDGTAAYNLDTTNDSGSLLLQEVSDRYFKRSNIFGIPSGFSIIMRQGQAYAMAMMGGDIIGPKMTPTALVGPDFTIKGPEFGLNLYYWKEGLSD